MTTWKPTTVQRDVIDRLKDGWKLLYAWPNLYIITKTGEPSRHVSSKTGDSLVMRGLVKCGERYGEMVLVDGDGA